MPRPPRIMGDDIHYHIVLRCNNKERLLQTKEDFETVLAMLAKTKKEFNFRLYNYVLMNSHIHLLLSTHDGIFIDQIMHNFCFKFAKNYNQKYSRSGHFWAHRYRSRIVMSNNHGLACLRYQHRNPLSAGLVVAPEDWPWSGFLFYSFGTPNNLLEFHPTFLGLADDQEGRQKIYRNLVYTTLSADKYKGIFEGRGKFSSHRFQILSDQINRLKQSYQ